MEIALLIIDMKEIIMDVSIIIINWNTKKLLDECIDSVLEKTHDLKYEIIIVDNASQDDSVDMLKRKYANRIILINNLVNLGFAKANNQGFEIAQGKYILLLNSDTLLLDNVILKSFEYMEDNKKCGVMGCKVLNPDLSTQYTCSNYPSLKNMLILTSGLNKLNWFNRFDSYTLNNWDRNNERDVDSVTGCYMLVRNTAIKQVGMLDPTFFMYGEETDWCKRLSALRLENTFFTCRENHSLRKPKQ